MKKNLSTFFILFSDRCGLILSVVLAAFLLYIIWPKDGIKRIDEIYVVTDSTIHKVSVVNRGIEIPVWPGRMMRTFWDTTEYSLPGVPVKVVNHKACYYSGFYIIKRGKPVKVSRVFKKQDGDLYLLVKEDGKLKQKKVSLNFLMSLEKGKYRSLYKSMRVDMELALFIDK